LGLGGLAAGPAAAQQNELISINAAGTAAGNGPSGAVSGRMGPRASADGRFVVFESQADDLIPGGTTPGFINVFLRDRLTQTTTLISRNTVGTLDGNGRSFSPTITPDGRYIVFLSNATDLVTLTDANGTLLDLFRFDTCFGATGECAPTMELVSINFAGTASGNGRVSGPSSPLEVFPHPLRTFVVSDDGNRILFPSRATDLVENFVDGNGSTRADLYLRDMALGQTLLVTGNATAPATAGSNGLHGTYDMDPAGALVVFSSSSQDLTDPGDADSIFDMFVREVLTAGAGALASPFQAQQEPALGLGPPVNLTLGSDNHSTGTAGGIARVENRLVLGWETQATNQGPPSDGNRANDIFVAQLVGLVRVDGYFISTNSDRTATANGPSADLFFGKSSNGGLSLALTSSGTDLVQEPVVQPGIVNLYRGDINPDGTRSDNQLVSVCEGNVANSDIVEYWFSRDGTYVLTTDADNLGPASGGALQVYFLTDGTWEQLTLTPGGDAGGDGNATHPFVIGNGDGREHIVHVNRSTNFGYSNPFNVDQVLATTVTITVEPPPDEPMVESLMCTQGSEAEGGREVTCEAVVKLGDDDCRDACTYSWDTEPDCEGFGPTNPTTGVCRFGENQINLEACDTFNQCDNKSTTFTVTEEPSPPKIDFLELNVFHPEGDDGIGDLAFTVTLSHPHHDGVTVDYKTSDGRHPTADRNDLEHISGMLEWPKGTNDPQQITVHVFGDIRYERLETFDIALHNPSENAHLPLNCHSDDLPHEYCATGWILNDDEEPTGDWERDGLLVPILFPRRSSPSNELGHGTNPSQHVTAQTFLELQGETEVQARFELTTSDGAGQAGRDYLALTDFPVVIPAGETMATVTLTILEDPDAQAGEVRDFFVNITKAEDAEIGNGQLQVTIEYIENQAPVIDTINSNPGSPVPATSNAGASVSFSATASDAEGDPLTFAWSGDCGSSNASSPTLLCSIGPNTVTLAVGDGQGPPATRSIEVVVADYTVEAACQGGMPPCNSPTMATISAGQSVEFVLTVTGVNDTYDANISFACQNLPALTTCTFTPGNSLPNAPKGGASIILKIQTTAPGIAQLHAPGNPQGSQPPLLALWLGVPGLALFGMALAGGPRRRRGRRLGALCLLGVVLAMATLLAGCGAGGDFFTGFGSPGTPTGSHSVTINATGVGTLERSVNLTVVVQ